MAFVAVENSSVFICYNICETSVQYEMPARNEIEYRKVQLLCDVQNENHKNDMSLVASRCRCVYASECVFVRDFFFVLLWLGQNIYELSIL